LGHSVFPNTFKCVDIKYVLLVSSFYRSSKEKNVFIKEKNFCVTWFTRLSGYWIVLAASYPLLGAAGVQYLPGLWPGDCPAAHGLPTRKVKRDDCKRKNKVGLYSCD
jgi:hypothetical protein